MYCARERSQAWIAIGLRCRRFGLLVLLIFTLPIWPSRARAEDPRQLVSTFTTNPSRLTWMRVLQRVETNPDAAPDWLRVAVRFDRAREQRDFPNSMSNERDPDEYRASMARSARVACEELRPLSATTSELWPVLEAMALQVDDPSIAVTGLELTKCLSDAKFEALANRIDGEVAANRRLVSLVQDEWLFWSQHLAGTPVPHAITPSRHLPDR